MFYFACLVLIFFGGIAIVAWFEYIRNRKAYRGGMKGGIPTPEQYYVLRDDIIQDKVNCFYGNALTVEVRSYSSPVDEVMGYLERMNFPDIKTSWLNRKESIRLRIAYQGDVYMLNISLNKFIRNAVNETIEDVYQALQDYEAMPRAKRIIKAAEREIYNEMV